VQMNLHSTHLENETTLFSLNAAFNFYFKTWKNLRNHLRVREDISYYLSYLTPQSTMISK